MFRTLPDRQTPTVTIFLDGHPVTAQAGENVAAVLLREAEPWARTTAETERAGTDGHPAERRGPYCLMGVCFDCRASVDGEPSTQTCQVSVREGMRVEREHAPRRLVP